MIERDPTPDDRLFTDYCDAETNWGPLLFFRPARNERIGLGRALAMSLLLGCLFGVIGNVILLLIGRALSRPFESPYILPSVLTVAYFVAAELTFVPAWNRRALRLSRLSRH
jgi:hypothetical protein